MIKRGLMAVTAAGFLAACGDPVSDEDLAAPPPPPPAPTAPAITTPVQMSANDFVAQATLSDLFEIETSRLALSRSTNADVKQFAQRMVDEHTRTSASLKAAMATSGQTVNVATQLDEGMRSQLATLTALPATEFDRRYLELQVEGHQRALSLMQRYGSSGDVPALKAFASTNAPTISSHLDQARQLRELHANQGGAQAAATAASAAAATNTPAQQ